MQRSTQDFSGWVWDSRPQCQLGSRCGSRFASGQGAYTQPITIGPDDYAAFERALQNIQVAYGREDVAAVWELATPRDGGLLPRGAERERAQGRDQQDLGREALQGDLSEAWREGSTEYATVAMRYAIQDWKVDRASNRVVAGDPSKAEEAVEIWTYRRDNGGPWKLSAIQQTA